MDKLLKYIAGEADDAEKKEIERLLKTDAQSRKEAEKLQKIWKNTPQSKSMPVDTEKAWQHVWQRINAEQNTRPESKKIKITRRKRNRWRTFSRVAAALFIGLGLSYMAYNQYFKVPEAKLLTAISGNQVKNMTLADGSKITLNKNSKLTHPEQFTGDLREVTLEGEAFFEVQHDKTKPFIIRAGSTEVKVLGTKFNVSTLKKDSVEVNVESGKVAFYALQESNRSEVILTKGEKGVYAENSGKIAEGETKNQNVMAWKTKLLRFKDALMTEVVQELSQFYEQDILVAESLKNCRLTAKFSDKPLNEVLETIGFMFGAKIEKSENNIKLTGGNCPE